MFDIGWSELLVVGLVALVVVGPKELPGLMRTIGGYIKKIKQTASQFQRQFEEAVEESEIGKLKSSVDELSRDLSPDKIMGGMGLDDEIMDEFDPDNYETFDVDDWNKKVMAEKDGDAYKPPKNSQVATGVNKDTEAVKEATPAQQDPLPDETAALKTSETVKGSQS
ncbi:MAG: sec-independent protein translocase protein TatB [Rhodomicrobium sp.]|nr:MAG: sec-independent protein translocase protein TatB [Rhodomicrobium sp.]